MIIPISVMAVKNVGSKMVLHDTNFPPELMEWCKEFSGKATGTNAVKETLYRLRAIHQNYRELVLKHKDLQADFDDARRLLADEFLVQERKKKLLPQFSESNRFRLHGE